MWDPAVPHPVISDDTSDALEHLFRHRVLRLLLCERRIDELVIRKLLGWRHSGFSLYIAVRIGAADSDGRRGVAEYILRSPFSLEKMRYQTKTGTIIYQSKMHPVLKRHFEVFLACDWMAALTAHRGSVWPSSHVSAFLEGLTQDIDARRTENQERP